jgi:hypothetical protein
MMEGEVVRARGQDMIEMSLGDLYRFISEALVVAFGH